MPSAAQILFWGYDTSVNLKTDKLHSHDFWQVDFILDGNIEVEVDRKRIKVPPNNIIIIPPGKRHRFIYHDELKKIWSLKFEIENFSGDYAVTNFFPDFELGLIRDNIISILQKRIKSRSVTDVSQGVYVSNDELPQDNILIDHLLSAMLEKQYATKEVAKPKEAEFITATRRLIHQHNGKPVKVDEIAKKVGYSKGHLSALFAKHTGMPLKTFIDRERFFIARNLLLYYNAHISKTADMMEFPDVFCFSKFFKRFHGKSPREFIKKTRGF